jgi:hypothetical protein
MLSPRTCRILLVVFSVWFSLFLGAKSAFSQDPTKLVDPARGSHPTLEQVVEKLTVRAEKLGCDSDDCALLVMNLATVSGSTVMLDRKLSDQLAGIFARTLPKGRVIDPSIVREFLARERIPYELLESDEVRRWVGKGLGATTALTGDLDVSGSVPQAKFELFDVKDSVKVNYFGAELPVAVYSPSDLQPPDPMGPIEVPRATESGAVVYQAGTAGLTSVTCDYMPNPPYSEAAREAKISGTILVDAQVTPEGTVESPQVVKG